MSNYKQSELVGVQWQRCKQVIINNPLEGAKTIYFQEEKVVNVGEQNLRQQLEGCIKTFTYNETFPLLDPSTNIPTGAVMSHIELYAALYSLYMQTAIERDLNITLT